MKRFLLLFALLCAHVFSKSQNLSYTCPRDTVLGCNIACLTLNARFPDLRALGNNYTFIEASPVSLCRPYDPPAVIGPSTNIQNDDRYSSVIPIGFNFPFYGTIYPSLVVSTNGYLSFDISLATAGAAWILTGNVPSTGYDGALIMGPWHDLDPTPTIGTSPTQQIKYNTIGIAPNRKWVLSFYKVPLFSGVCNDSILNTHQIVLHETTGVIEVFIFDKQICTSWNSGKAMVGLQDITKTKGIVPPGRGASDPPWGSVGMNEVWRFIPSGGAPLYRSVVLLDASGTQVAVGDTTTRINVNTFEATFPNICPPAGASFYVVKTTYAQLNNPAATLFSLDTINIIRQAALPLSAAMTPTTCGASTGSITITANGTPGYQYSIDGGPVQTTPTFPNLPVGPHTITVVDATGCNNSINVNITSLSALPSTVIKTNVSCTGVNNGTITVTPTAGVGPYTFSIDGGVTTQPTGYFPNLGPGTYTITFIDANLCAGTTSAINIPAGTSITATTSSTNTTCNAAVDGTITVSPDVAGSYTFTISPGGTTNTTGIFTGLATNTYSVTFTNTVTGCSGTESGITISVGTTISSSWSHIDETCPGANDGIITIVPAVPASYSYVLNPGGVTNTTGIFPGMSPGIFYSVTYTNTVTGCSGTKSTMFVLPAATVTGTQAHTDATCPGVNDGSITITPSPLAGTYTYTLTPGAIVNTTGLFTGLAPNTYSVSFTNAGGCGTTVSNIIIITGAGTTASSTQTNAACTGVSNGTITVIPPATGGPFIYTLNPGNVIQNNNPLFTGLAAGPYTITYTTGAGCGGTVNPSPVVGASSSPTSTATLTNATCSGINNGTISVVPPASGGPFTYTLNPGNIVQVNNPLFTGVATGTYNITFTTATGCIGTVPAVTVGSGSNPVTTATGGTTTCPGVNDGSVFVLAPATGGPFIYTLNPGAVTNNTGIFPGLAPGIYTITFTTAVGCIGTVPLNPTVLTGAAPNTTVLATNATCPGVNDGVLTITPPVTGGPFIYTLNPGNIIQNNNPVFAGLAPGTYTITFSTATGCNGTVTGNTSIGPGTAPTAAATATATTCPGVDDGTITIIPPAIGAPFIYTLNPGNIIQNNNPVFTLLAPGPYTITFATSLGCTGTVSGNTTVGTGTAPTTPATATPTTCPGVNDGTITVTPPATGAPFVYTLNPGNIVQNNNPVFTGIAAGTYTITFTTALGCSGTVTGNTTVSGGPAPTTPASATGTTCPGVNDGTITITPPATGAPFAYTLNPGNIVQNNNPVFISLAPGPYTITYTTALGCSGTVTGNSTVTTGTPLSGSITLGHPRCANINDGTITIVPSLAGIYSYILNPGLPTEVIQANNPLFTGLAPGNYTYSFTNASGCIGTGIAVLTTNSPLATTVSMTMPLCNGNTNGIITLNASGGVGPYQYAISPFTTFQGATFNGLAAGIYTFRIKDNVGCTKDTTVTLAEPTILSASAVSTAGTCNGNDGSITVTGSGGTPAYTYSTDNGVTYQVSPTFIVSGGSFPDIRVKDSKGCIANTAVVVTLIDNMSLLFIGNDTTICVEQTVTFQPQVSAQASIFTWTTIPDSTLITTLDYDTIKNPVATPLDTTTYVLNAQWGVCNRIDTITINVLHKPIANAGPNVAVCFDSTITTLSGTATNLSGTVNFEWSDSTNLQTPHNAVTIATPPVTETFLLTVTDNYGCGFSVTDSVLVTVQPPVPAFAGNDTIAVLNQPHQLAASGGVAYTWSPAASLNLSTISNPLATLDHDQLFVVTVTDEAGCLGNDNVFVQVFEGPAYHVPNAFSPNGDGLNDIFRITPAGISYTEWFRVFNRYGELVFETNKWLKGWDGSYLGKKQPVGNYVWAVKGVNKYGKIVEMKGTVLLIR
ncbi:MAG: gliding motility-associated C-terminal domain-containing protein [Ferruginibacter sp.]|nr:gliding motility-associated C-terminal domain-containing protein [Ferruginibacter sp.]